MKGISAKRAAAIAAATGLLAGMGMPAVAAYAVNGNENVDANAGQESKDEKEKVRVPTVLKEVKDLNGTWDAGYSRSADLSGKDLDGNVRYRITATLPQDLADYETYYFEIVDVLPDGMCVSDLDDVKVFYGEKDVTARFTASSSDGKVSWACEDILTFVPKETGSDYVFTVEYTAGFGDSIKGRLLSPDRSLFDPECNCAHVTYKDKEGNKLDTPDSCAAVYSYVLRVEKSGEGGEPLEGATFELRDSDDETVGSAVTSSDGSCAFVGVEAGFYTLVETSAPSGYSAIEPIRLSVDAVAEDDGTVKAIAVAEESDPSNAATLSAGGATITASVMDLRDGTSSVIDRITGLTKTGDSVWPFVATAVVGAAAGALAVLAGKRSRRDKE